MRNISASLTKEQIRQSVCVDSGAFTCSGDIKCSLPANPSNRVTSPSLVAPLHTRARTSKSATIMQTTAGAAKTAAKLIGVSIEEYESKIRDGFKWCRGCKGWHLKTNFPVDASRGDGLGTMCAASRNAYQRSRHTPIPASLRKPMGPQPFSERDGDKLQARASVNRLVRRGKIPSPSTLPCHTCGHTGTDKHHEYHHHNGYGAGHHLDVIVLCGTCHKTGDLNPKRIRKYAKN